MNRFRVTMIGVLIFLFTFLVPLLAWALDVEAPPADPTFVDQVFTPQVTAMCAVVTFLIESAIRIFPAFWETERGDVLLGALPAILCSFGAWLIPGVIPEDTDLWSTLLFGGMLGASVGATVRSFKRGYKAVKPSAAAPAVPPAAPAGG